LDAGDAGGEGVGGAQVVGLEVRILGENVGLGGIAGEEFKKELDGIAQAADAGFAVADVGRHGDAAEEFFGGHDDGKVSDWRIIASGEWRAREVV
jgi:hypothetical protein